MSGNPHLRALAYHSHEGVRTEIVSPVTRIDIRSARAGERGSAPSASGRSSCFDCQSRPRTSRFFNQTSGGRCSCKQGNASTISNLSKSGLLHGCVGLCKRMNNTFQKRFVAKPKLFLEVEAERIDKLRLLRKSGDTIQLSIPLVALVMTVFSIDVSSVTLIYSLAVCVLTTHLLKYSLKLPRPNGGKHSFPSGHTSFAFVGASFVHLHFESTIAVLLYFCASYVALTRVITRKHYPRDVFAGALIGTGSALIFSY